MSETTLSKQDNGNGTSSFQREAWLLGLELVPNVEKALSPEQVTFHRGNKRGYVEALRRGFPLPWEIPIPAVPVETTGYPLEETDCLQWLGHMEQFATDHFGGGAQPGFLQQMFALPQRLPWKAVLPIFDPGLTNRQMEDKALRARNLDVYEGVDVMKYSGSGAFGAPRLYLVERSSVPTPATMGLPPKFAKRWFSGRQTVPLNLRGYGIGTALWYKVEKQFFDPGAQTVTWFPENILPGGDVAFGYCFLPNGEVKFSCCDAGYEGGCYGFREAILLFQKS